MKSVLGIDVQQLTEGGRKLTLSADNTGTNYTCVATNQSGSSHIFIAM